MGTIIISLVLHAYASVASVVAVVCDICTVAKRCVLEQKLLLTARKSFMRNQLVPKWMTLTFVSRSFKVMSTIALHSPLTISETARDAWFQRTIGNGLWGIKWSRDRWRHMTQKGQTLDPNTLRPQYLVNSWRCYLATTNYYSQLWVRSAILATAWLLVLL